MTHLIDSAWEAGYADGKQKAKADVERLRNRVISCGFCPEHDEPMKHMYRDDLALAIQVCPTCNKTRDEMRA